jgi:uncharacterized protein (DUF342 family)
MKLRIPIKELRSGMFLEASVLSVMKDDSVRHFLELRGAAYSESTSKRMRLMKRRHEQVTVAGGMLVKSDAQVEALHGLGVIEVTINTDKSDVVPDLPELKEEKARAGPAERAGDGDDDNISVSDLDAPETPVHPDEKVAQTSAAPGVSDRRRNFGPTKSGWMKVEVSHTRNDAVLQVLSFGGDAKLSEQDMMDVLRDEYGIQGGIDVEMVKHLAMQAAASPGRVLRGHFPIGTDLDLDRSTLGHIEFTCLKELPEDTDLFSEALKEAFALHQLADVLAGAPSARLAMPGEELARFVAAGGDRGTTTDEDLAVMARKLLRAGPHVQSVGEFYIAKLYGYICIVDDEISIFPPVWTTPERMQAYFVRLPQIGSEVAMNEQWLRQLLQLCEVNHGLKVDGLEKLLLQSEPSATAEAVLLAEGTAGIEAEASKMTLNFAHATDHAAPVMAGDLLAEVTPAKAGKPGVDVSGVQTATGETDTATLMAGNNVRVESRDGGEYLFAERDGRANIRNQVLCVRPVSIVDGDLDSDLEVEEGRDVHIRGSLKSGAKLTAKGAVIIDGSVENGARVDSQAGVTVKGGVVGRAARVVGAGDVSVGFAAQSSVCAAGDLTIGDRSENATLHAGGRLLFAPTGSGRVTGGKLAAGIGIEARVIDHGRGQESVLRIVPDGELSSKIEQAERGLETCRTHTLRIFRTLGVNEISATHFKRLIETSPPHERKKVAGLLRQLKLVASSRAKSEERKRELEDEQNRIYEGTPIMISEEVAAGVMIKIGEAALETGARSAGVAFGKSGKDIVATAKPGG